MIDITTEKLVDLNEAARLLPKNDGKRVPLVVIWRWCTKGIGPDHLKLEYVKLGREIFTSEEAVYQFRLVAAAYIRAWRPRKSGEACPTQKKSS